MGKKTREELAAVILSMSYGELVRVGDAMAQMRRAQLKSAEDFAAMLYEWAEGQ